MQPLARSFENFAPAPLAPPAPTAIPLKAYRHGRPLHIVHTEASLGWGGQEIRILDESAGMMARGHHVTLLCPPDAIIFQAAAQRGITVVPLAMKRKSVAGVLAARQWLREHQPDVVNTHSSTDSWLIALANLLSRQPVPVVRTRHVSTPVKSDPISRWLYGKSADRIVTTGESIRQELLRRVGLPPERVVSVPTGVDLRRFDRHHSLDRYTMRRQLGIPTEKKVIGIIATLRSWKGHDYLLDALPTVIAAVPDTHLIIVGDGPRRQHIEQRLRSYPQPKCISLIGQRTDVANILAALDLAVLPSFGNEGVPQALMQAMAMGVAVVSTPVGAIGELVQNGITGSLVPPCNADALANELIRLLRNPFLRHSQGLAGQRAVKARFSQETMLDSMEAIFRLTATSRKRRH